MKNALLTTLAWSLALGGCSGMSSEYASPSRQSNGLVVILPGIEGVSPLNENIREGLDTAGVSYALPIYSWGRPVPGVGVLMNQVDFVGNHLAGVGIARMIIEYQNANPGRPVYVMGHSGGGGVAVFTAEALADLDANRQIDGLVLLSASISGDYDLTKALSTCRKGIVNFYNENDVGLLGIGTAVAGNVDGGRAASAGRVGFDQSYGHLFQIPVDSGMAGDGEAHASTTNVPFVGRYVAPWIRAGLWPPGSGEPSAMLDESPRVKTYRSAAKPVAAKAPALPPAGTAASAAGTAPAALAQADPPIALQVASASATPAAAAAPKPAATPAPTPLTPGAASDKKNRAIIKAIALDDDEQ